MNCSTDWSLLVQGFMSFTWCEETMRAEHQGRLVSDLLSEFKSKNGGVNPLNIGSMLAEDTYILCILSKVNLKV